MWVWVWLWARMVEDGEKQGRNVSWLGLCRKGLRGLGDLVFGMHPMGEVG